MATLRTYSPKGARVLKPLGRRCLLPRLRALLRRENRNESCPSRLSWFGRLASLFVAAPRCFINKAERQFRVAPHLIPFGMLNLAPGLQRNVTARGDARPLTAAQACGAKQSLPGHKRGVSAASLPKAQRNLDIPYDSRHDVGMKALFQLIPKTS